MEGTEPHSHQRWGPPLHLYLTLGMGAQCSMALVQGTHRNTASAPGPCTHPSPIWMEATRLCFYTIAWPIASALLSCKRSPLLDHIWEHGILRASYPRLLV